jgi:hypothetical protein
VTGWSADYILRQLPVAMGLQIILWHDLKAGRKMRWSVGMNEGRGSVDIAAQMRKTLAQANSNEDYGND